MCVLVVIATAPGKLILTGEYAVLDGAPALVIAVDRRVIATGASARCSSPFLLAVARELALRYGADSPSARAALRVAVDSSAFYAASDCTQKLGLGSSAAVTVAAAALALAAQGSNDRDEVLAIALAAHANAQGTKGARGSGADIAAAVYGGAIVYTMAREHEAAISLGANQHGMVAGEIARDSDVVRDPDASICDPDASVRDPEGDVRDPDDERGPASASDRRHTLDAAVRDPDASVRDPDASVRDPEASVCNPEAVRDPEASVRDPEAGRDPEASVRDPEDDVREPDDDVREPDDERGSASASDRRQPQDAGRTANDASDLLPRVVRHRWPDGVVLIPFFTGVSADTATLVSQIEAARAAHPVAVDAALTAIAEASRAACASLAGPPDLAAAALIAALRLAAEATDQLATATGVALVPPCVTAARSALRALGGTAKTTGAGGGDVAIAVVPASVNVTTATRALIEAGCQPLQLTVDDSGVDTRPAAQ